MSDGALQAGTLPFASFDHRCLVSPVAVSADFFAPTATFFGLPQVSAFLFGTVSDAEGNAWTYARDLPPHGSNGAMLMGNAGADAMHIRSEAAQLWRGSVLFAREDAQGEWMSGDGVRGDPSFRMTHRIDDIAIAESGVLALSGARKGPGYQWYDPTAQMGAVCIMHFVTGTVLDRLVAGWIGLDFHYQRPGLNHFLSPLVAGGISLAWVTFGTMFADGSWESGLMAKGRKGWGMAIVGDSDGGLAQSNRIAAEFDIGADEYPRIMRFACVDEISGAPMAWAWQAAPRAAMVDIPASAPSRRHNRGAEGVVLRQGEGRTVVHASAWTEFFADGRVDEWRRERR
jgi:hypothetical protein